MNLIWRELRLIGSMLRLSLKRTSLSQIEPLMPLSEYEIGRIRGKIQYD